MQNDERQLAGALDDLGRLQDAIQSRREQRIPLLYQFAQEAQEWLQGTAMQVEASEDKVTFRAFGRDVFSLAVDDHGNWILPGTTASLYGRGIAALTKAGSKVLIELRPGTQYGVETKTVADFVATLINVVVAEERKLLF